MAAKHYFWYLLMLSGLMTITMLLLTRWRKHYAATTLDKHVPLPSTDGFRMTSNRQNMTTKRITFTKMKYGYAYILGVAAGNSTENRTWDVFKVYASIIDAKFRNESVFRCCYMFDVRDDNGTQFIEAKPVLVRKHPSVCFVRAYHFTCPNPWYSFDIVPKKVGLTTLGIRCKDEKVLYIQPFYPKREPDIKLAIGTKIAFGNISAELIIEWMEAYKRLGVDKVVSYYIPDINPDALKVLNHYSSTGILDLYLFEPAASETYPRTFSYHNRQKWNDQRMVIYDSFEKMFGYTYFGIIDHDEFLVPSRNRSLKEMLADLFQNSSEAIGFRFKTQFFYLSWGISGHTNETILGRYINRTEFPPRLDKEKSIYKPKLVSPGGVGTHTIYPRDAIKTAPAEEGYIRHFRECRSELRDHCLQKYRRVKDEEMAEWSKGILENVRRTRQHIFGS